LVPSGRQDLRLGRAAPGVTFQTLAALAGHGEIPATRATGTKKIAAPGIPTKKTAAKKSATSKVDTRTPPPPPPEEERTPPAKADVGLTVRIEVNLPPGGNADTYDAIFASIKKHLMS
jgi:hypothetical protein